MARLRVTALLIGVLAIAAAACDGGEKTGPAYDPLEEAAFMLGKEYSLAMLLQPANPQAAIEPWTWTNQYSSILGIQPPDMFCTDSMLACMAIERDRIGAQLEAGYGGRAARLYEVMVDTAMVGAALFDGDEATAGALCNHIEARYATAELPEERWRALCGTPIAFDFDAKMDQLIESREDLVSWVRDRVDVTAGLDGDMLGSETSNPN